jgi:tetratricopeptide (TPR) repeat protein
MELNPSYAPAYLWYASALASSPGREEEAIEVLRKTLEIDPLSRVAQNNIAANYLELGRYTEAEAQWRRLVTLDPDYPTGYLGLYRLNRNVFFRLDEAHRWLLKGHGASERDVRNTIEFVFLYSDLGMVEDSRRWARRIALESPEHPMAALLPVYEAVYNKDFTRADELTRPLMETDLSNITNLRSARILALTMLNRTGDALAIAEQWNPELLSAEPIVNNDNHGASNEVLFALSRSGNHEQARRLLAAARAHQARDHANVSPAQTAITLALSSAAGGDDQPAVRMLDEAIDQGWLGTAEWGWKLIESEFLGEIATSPEVVQLQARVDMALAEQRVKVQQQLTELGAGARF